MSQNALDPVDSVEQRIPLKPIWQDGMHTTEEGILKWFQETYMVLEDMSRARLEGMGSNLLWYTGDWMSATSFRRLQRVPGERRDAAAPRGTPPFVVNHL